MGTRAAALIVLSVFVGCASRSAVSDDGSTDPGSTEWCAKDTCPALCDLTDCKVSLYVLDYDSDGIEDSNDNCPRVTNKSQLDSDGDMHGDPCDVCPKHKDSAQLDSDGDGMGDACDKDKDNDGIPNAADNCPLVATSASSSPDTDKDGQGDACDKDDDGDGVADDQDNCPLVANPTQQPWYPKTACDRDTDHDGINDSLDNCLAVPNPAQIANDSDELGDACNADKDGDGVANIKDNCADVKNQSQADLDRDGLGDACDSHSCLVIGGDKKNCLDPKTTLRCYSPTVQLDAGQARRLPMFINRTGVSARYSWLVQDRPAGAKVILYNASGTCGPSKSFLCSTDPAARFGVLVDSPGTYKLKLTVELTGPDPVNPSFPRKATYVLTTTVGGSKVCIPSKC